MSNTWLLLDYFLLLLKELGAYITMKWCMVFRESSVIFNLRVVSKNFYNWAATWLHTCKIYADKRWNALVCAYIKSPSFGMVSITVTLRLSKLYRSLMCHHYVACKYLSYGYRLVSSYSKIPVTTGVVIFAYVGINISPFTARTYVHTRLYRVREIHRQSDLYRPGNNFIQKP